MVTVPAEVEKPLCLSSRLYSGLVMAFRFRDMKRTTKEFCFIAVSQNYQVFTEKEASLKRVAFRFF